MKILQYTVTGYPFTSTKFNLPTIVINILAKASDFPARRSYVLKSKTWLKKKHAICINERKIATHPERTFQKLYSSLLRTVFGIREI